MAEKRFTFDDIVADLVKKEIVKQAGGSGGGDIMNFLGIRNINDITRFIQALQTLQGTINKTPPRSVVKASPEPQNGTSQAPTEGSPHTGMAINPKMVFDGLVSVMQGIKTVAGDITMTEAIAFLQQNEAQILPVIESQLAGIKQ